MMWIIYSWEQDFFSLTYAGSLIVVVQKGEGAQETGFAETLKSKCTFNGALFDVVKFMAVINFIDVFIALEKEEAGEKYSTYSSSAARK